MSDRKDEEESIDLGAPQKKPRLCGKPDSYKDTLQAELDKELSVLAPSRIPLERFTVDALGREGLSVPKFLKLVRVITHLTDFAVIKLVLEWGASRGIFSSESDMTVRELADMCRVLRKPEGQAAVTAQQRRVKLEKKAGTRSTSVCSIALSRILMIQHEDYTIWVKGLWKDSNVSNFSAEHAAIDAEMVPASKFAPPLSGRRPFDTVEGMIKFCEQEGVKEQLVAYARKKISELDAGLKKRRANRLRDTLACVEVGSSSQ